MKLVGRPRPSIAQWSLPRMRLKGCVKACGDTLPPLLTQAVTRVRRVRIPARPGLVPVASLEQRSAQEPVEVGLPDRRDRPREHRSRRLGHEQHAGRVTKFVDSRMTVRDAGKYCLRMQVFHRVAFLYSGLLQLRPLAPQPLHRRRP
ncbi:MAG TPA: hypothetical protein VN201_06810 [Roseateles sp.]|nr:hypothetical protein [Roseateles sp.]